MADIFRDYGVVHLVVFDDEARYIWRALRDRRIWLGELDLVGEQSESISLMESDLNSVILNYGEQPA